MMEAQRGSPCRDLADDAVLGLLGYDLGLTEAELVAVVAPLLPMSPLPSPPATPGDVFGCAPSLARAPTLDRSYPSADSDAGPRTPEPIRIITRSVSAMHMRGKGGKGAGAGSLPRSVSESNRNFRHLAVVT